MSTCPWSILAELSCASWSSLLLFVVEQLSTFYTMERSFPWRLPVISDKTDKADFFHCTKLLQEWSWPGTTYYLVDPLTRKGRIHLAESFCLFGPFSADLRSKWSLFMIYSTVFISGRLIRHIDIYLRVYKRILQLSQHNNLQVTKRTMLQHS